MKKLLSIIVLGLLLSSTSFAGVDGKGEIQLSIRVVNNFISYMLGETSSGKSSNNKPMVFWVTLDGNNSFWWYCSHGSCQGSRPSVEKKACEKRHGTECARFARQRSVRWDNGINPKGKAARFSSKMTKDEVIDKLNQLGFYNNNIIEKQENITPKVKKKLLTTKESANDKDIVKKLKDLKDLLDAGVLTKEEFEKAKKKLLN